MPKTPLVWTADAFNNAFSAQVANVTYHVTSRDYGYPAYLEVVSPRGGRNGSTSVTTSKSSRLSGPVSGTTGPVAI